MFAAISTLVGEWKPATVKANGVEFERDPVKNMWDRETDILFFMRDGKRHGIAVEDIEPDAATFRPIRERLMEVLKKAKPVAQTGGAPAAGGGPADGAKSVNSPPVRVPGD